MKYAVFSCSGLGDGLLALIVSHNLQKHGHEVTTFHPSLSQLQGWFPHLPIRPFPPNLAEFDRLIFIYEKTEWSQAALQEALKTRRDQTTVLNPIATPKTDYPYWEEGQFDGTRPFGENLKRFCQNRLQHPQATKGNGITLPPGVTLKKHPKRVILHPTSSRPGKNWTASKFKKLALRLKEEGWDPVFIVAPHERGAWPEAPAFASLAEMATFVAESGYMIGNDSGIGHLASCLGLPTVTLCRNKRTANFWRPDWAPGKVCLPAPWLPNIKGLRLRDQHWQWGISVSHVIQAFSSLSGL
jgi:hypothetical protein